MGFFTANHDTNANASRLPVYVYVYGFGVASRLVLIRVNGDHYSNSK